MASNTRAAIARASADVLRQVSHRRVHQIKASVTIIELERVTGVQEQETIAA